MSDLSEELTEAILESYEFEDGGYYDTPLTHRLRAAVVLAEAQAAEISRLRKEVADLREAARRAFDCEDAALRKYRDEGCQGYDDVKRHAWTVADARLSEVAVLRRKLAEVGVFAVLTEGEQG